jgi:hypothetical protein
VEDSRRYLTALYSLATLASKERTLFVAIQRYADTLILDQPLDEVAPLRRSMVADDLRAFLNFAENGGLLT